ncbi:endonuclease/exonuclease/phosphatase family protein [Actinosynnema sp. NPDC023587]|uniref:endonuclease/exonuclease/phosphatase family protein n=1 Tax=Actinosynnema sp. NPDC023587 TaxID=3154695 RepID=UPI00340954AE
MRSVEDRRPAFVTIQEACRDWNDRLENRLPGYSVAFHPVRGGDGTTARCKHPSDFGNAVLVRDDLGFDVSRAVPHDLGSPDGYEKREVLCVRSESRRIVVCSTYLTVGNDDEPLRVRRQEAAKVKGILADYAGDTRFLGGDFNDDPLSAVADNFYHPNYEYGAHGEFKEADSPCGNEVKRGFRVWVAWIPCRSGESTHDQGKIDLLFVPPAVHLDRADATHATHSDHDPLWAGVQF